LAHGITARDLFGNAMVEIGDIARQGRDLRVYAGPFSVTTGLPMELCDLEGQPQMLLSTEIANMWPFLMLQQDVMGSVPIPDSFSARRPQCIILRSVAGIAQPLGAGRTTLRCDVSPGTDTQPTLSTAMESKLMSLAAAPNAGVVLVIFGLVGVVLAQILNLVQTNNWFVYFTDWSVNAHGHAGS
jgi:hypothetical protein